MEYQYFGHRAIGNQTDADGTMIVSVAAAPFFVSHRGDTFTIDD